MCCATSPADAIEDARDTTVSEVAWQAQAQRALWGKASDEPCCPWPSDRPACPNRQAAANTMSAA